MHHEFCSTSGPYIQMGHFEFNAVNCVRGLLNKNIHTQSVIHRKDTSRFNPALVVKRLVNVKFGKPLLLHSNTKGLDTSEFQEPCISSSDVSRTMRCRVSNSHLTGRRFHNAARSVFDADCIRQVLGNCHAQSEQISILLRNVLICFTIGTLFTMSPTLTWNNGCIYFTENVALAQPIGQIRQLAQALERIAGGSTSTRVIDRVLTVISGQTVVTPETVEQLKSVIDGEKDVQDWQKDIADNVENMWFSSLDLVSHFNPLSLIDSAGTSIQGLVEVGFERVAAFELSTLVALGERWLLWAPFVAIPMYLQMSWGRSVDSKTPREKSDASAAELSEEARAKASRVRAELERIRLKESLLDMVSSLGQLALQSSRPNQGQTRKQINEILIRLQELNPVQSDIQNEDVDVDDLDVDGNWMLIYVSQGLQPNNESEIPRIPNLDILGVEIRNMQQKVWQNGSRATTLTSETGEAQNMMAKNTAHVRLGPLGVIELSVQGSWENLKNGRGAIVSFDTFSARPIEVFGSRLRDDIPPLDVPIPRSFQTAGEWELVYLDNSLRINKGRNGQFYLLRKV